MAESSALIELKKVVQRYVFKYKLPNEDFVNYFEHATDCVRDLNVHAISSSRRVPIAVDALGVLAMPTDMIGLVGVALEFKGELWFFTEKQYMIVQAADSVMPTDAEPTWSSYGTTGAKNQFYFRADWKGRVIYIDGAESQTVTLVYFSSGLNIDAATTVPTICTPSIDSYLRWAQGEIEGKSINEQLKRERKYEGEFRLLKLQALPSLTDIRDYFLGITTQAAQR